VTPLPLPIRVGEIFLCPFLINSPTRFARRGNIINAAISKAKTFNRSDILERRHSKKNDRVVLALKFNSKLPSVPTSLKNIGLLRLKILS
jgi:hypothetical protein